MTPQREVLVISFGPVQGFVAASRKTRDLTLGSLLLSRLCAAAAHALPSVPGVEHLVVPPSDDARRASGVSNKLVLVIKAGHAAPVAAEARRAAMVALQTITDGVRKRASASSIHEQDFQNQVDRFLECTWASMPMASDKHFGKARSAADLSLDGRKALRDFASYTVTDGRVKASVDGRLESVVLDPSRMRTRLGPGVLRENEHVDAMGLVRRLWKTESSECAPSTAQIAIGPWLRVVRDSVEGSQALGTIEAKRSALAQAVQEECASEADLEVLDDDYSWALEPGTVRLRELAGLWHGSLPSAVKQSLTAFDEAIDALLARKAAFGRPSPYYAIISADGDQMGQAFSGLQTASEHEAASRRLAQFTETVGRIGQRLRVHVAYAGGDDLLALASLDDALPFVADVHQAFRSVGDAFPSAPTLSVGVAIVHHGERLSDAVRLAHSAERAAKEEPGGHGNRLTVLLSKRSGGDLRAVLPFSAGPTKLLDGLVDFLREGELARGFAHELARLAPLLQHVPTGAASKEIERVLARKRSSDGETMSAELKGELLEITGIAEAATGDVFVRACKSLSDLLRIALHLAENTQRPINAGAGEST